MGRKEDEDDSVLLFPLNINEDGDGHVYWSY
jgi:hypothetical protein